MKIYSPFFAAVELKTPGVNNLNVICGRSAIGYFSFFKCWLVETAVSRSVRGWCNGMSHHKAPAVFWRAREKMSFSRQFDINLHKQDPIRI